jgi:hypothetical protein
VEVGLCQINDLAELTKVTSGCSLTSAWQVHHFSSIWFVGHSLYPGLHLKDASDGMIAKRAWKEMKQAQSTHCAK